MNTHDTNYSIYGVYVYNLFHNNVQQQQARAAHRKIPSKQEVGGNQITIMIY